MSKNEAATEGDKKKLPRLPIEVVSTDVTDDITLDFAKELISDAMQEALTESFGDNNKMYGKAAKMIKEGLEKSHSQTWHVVVGRNFGSKVIHETRTFMFMQCKQTSILIWKCG